MVRKDIAAVKVAMPKVYTTSPHAPCTCTARSASPTRCRSCDMMTSSQVMGLADGPTEVHKVTVAKQVLKDYEPGDPVYPSGYRPALRDKARELVAQRLEHIVGNL